MEKIDVKIVLNEDEHKRKDHMSLFQIIVEFFLEKKSLVLFLFKSQTFFEKICI